MEINERFPDESAEYTHKHLYSIEKEFIKKKQPIVYESVQ